MLIRLIFLFLMPLQLYAGGLAVTFDDLPGQDYENFESQKYINEKILNTLAENQVPSIGFVNEGGFFVDEQSADRIKMIKRWVENGHALGNHTYSHMDLNTVSTNDYFHDIVRGAKVFQYRYFRHPYLHTGKTKEILETVETYLSSNGYIIAPVTIDTDDWVFNQQLADRPELRDTIIQNYLEHTRKKFEFYQEATKTIFGREIDHIWLLHVNRINAESMPELLKIAREFGYHFITLDKALRDNAYLTQNTYYNEFGVSWLYRWDYSNGLKVDWSKEPEPQIANSMGNHFSEMESKTGVKIGLSAVNTANGDIINNRSNERFATGSTYKFIVASAVLEKSISDPNIMNEKIQIKKEDLVSWAPVSKVNVNQFLTIRQLTEAALKFSDGTAANLLTKRLGGPKALTQYARSIGDQKFMNTNYEPVDTTPGNHNDSTTPESMRKTLESVILGNGLPKMQQDQIRQWMIENTSGDTRIRAGVPKGWIVADKTGAGNYGVRNDIAVIWPTGCQPIVLTLYTTQDKKDAVYNDDVLVRSTRVVIEEFSKHDECISNALRNR